MSKDLCRHFGVCGGCSFQDIPYAKQLADKEKIIGDFAQQHGFTCPIKPINHFDPEFYRNKMEFTFGGNLEKLFLGMNAKNGAGIFDLEECRIFSPDAGKILAALREFCLVRGLISYNKYNHKGFLRFLIVRETKFTRQLMIGIVTSSQAQLDKEGFVKCLQDLSLAARVKSIYHVVSDSWSDAVVFEQKERLWGEEFIREAVEGVKFNLGIDSFFQVNPLGMVQLYTKIREYAGLTGNERVLDLFCGVGSIGLFLAAQAKFVWGVELAPAIVEAAKTNAALNDVKNISFFAQDARKFLNTQGDFYRNVDIAIVNPPRCGVSEKFIRALVRISPKIIIYSSCNPQSQFADISRIKDQYEPLFFEPFDFFPHTRHLECLTLLRRK